MKNNQIKLLLLLMAVPFFLGSCKEKYPGEPLTIWNNSKYDIYYWFSYWKTENHTQFHYPDTTLPIHKPTGILLILPSHAIGPGEADPDWITIFSELPAGKLSVYFFEKYPDTQADWDSIRLNYDFVRKDVTYKELMDNNYNIYYP